MLGNFFLILHETLGFFYKLSTRFNGIFRYKKLVLKISLFKKYHFYYLKLKYKTSFFLIITKI